MEKISIILKCEEVKNVKSQLYFLLDMEIDFLKMNVINDKIIIKGYSYNIENVKYIIERFNNVEILEFSVSKEILKGWQTFNDCVDSGKITIKFNKNEIKVIWSNDWVPFFDSIKHMFDCVRIFSKNKKLVVATKKYKDIEWLDVRDEILDIMEFLDNEELEDFEDDYLDNGDCQIENPMYEFWDNFNQY